MTFFHNFLVNLFFNSVEVTPQSEQSSFPTWNFNLLRILFFLLRNRLRHCGKGKRVSNLSPKRKKRSVPGGTSAFVALHLNWWGAYMEVPL